MVLFYSGPMRFFLRFPFQKGRNAVFFLIRSGAWEAEFFGREQFGIIPGTEGEFLRSPLYDARKLFF